MRILLLDDEVRLLDSFRRFLGVAHRDWEVVTAASGAEGIRRLGEGRFDVLVTDMQMPGLDGAAVLREARSLAPSTVRILLSGQAGRERILACESSFHQFLAKPVSPGGLLAVLDALDQGSARPEAILARQMVAGLEWIPSLPRWHQAMAEQLQRETADPDDIAQVIRQDPGLASKVMKLVNSPYLARDLKVADLSKAVELLSLDLLRDAVLRFGVVGAAPSLAPAGLDLERLREGSVRVATATRFLALATGQSARVAEECYTSGLLHDIGRVVFAMEPGLGYQELQPPLPCPGEHLCAQEQERYGTDHAEVGAELLTIWGVDRTICEAIRHHHGGGSPAPEGFSISLALRVADAWSAALPGPDPRAAGADFAALFRLLEGADDFRQPSPCPLP